MCILHLVIIQSLPCYGKDYLFDCQGHKPTSINYEMFRGILENKARTLIYESRGAGGSVLPVLQSPELAEGSAAEGPALRSSPSEALA